MDRLEEIRQRTEAATPGPWDAKTNCYPECNGEPWGWISGASCHITWSGSKGQINANFIAHSREDMEWLLTLADALKAQLASTLTRAEAAEAERDAAIADWRGFCAKCSKRSKQYLSDGQMDAVCATCRANGKCNWEWCGQEAGKGDSDGAE